MMAGVLRLTRRYRFCASHRLHSDALSERENRELYGKCNNPHGHGHNYLLEIMVGGRVDPRTGQVIQVRDLDHLVENCIVKNFDHRDLNTEVPEFNALVPTSENLAAVIERRLNESWGGSFPPEGPRLVNVRLHETKRNRFELR